MGNFDDKALWCLYCQTDEVLHEGLTFGEARAIISMLTPEQKISWFAWRDGWPSWKPLASCFELIVTINRRAMPHPPPAVPRQQKQAPIPQQTSTSISKPVDLLKRRHRRYEFMMEIEIICNGRSFRSQTVDVSLGGIRLRDIIPDWVAGYLTVFITHPTSAERIEFMGTLVENQNVSDKRRLEILPGAGQKRLKNWLETSGAHVLSDEETTGDPKAS